MPDLGKYAVEVSAAYGVSIALIIGLVWISVLRSRAVKRALQEAEARRNG